jgi:hypothetical protein
MSSRRAAAYIGGAVVLAAWLASAASAPMRSGEAAQSLQPVATIGTELLATDVQRQSARLRQRLATAPAPQEPRRNPFTFAERELPRSQTSLRRLAAALPVQDAEPPPLEPVLSLVGVAEQQSANGLVRTAILVGESDELYTVTAGQTLIDRYTVSAIGPDVVELKDSATGLTRRLALH